MPDFSLPYGKSHLKVNIPNRWPVTLVAPVPLRAAADPIEVVNRALDEPVGNRRLQDLAGAESVAIAINDKTRPVPHRHLLPPLLARLEAMGLPAEAITLLIATGTHPPMPPSEFAQVVPPHILARYRVMCHDAYDDESLVHLGQTGRGTPVWLNRHYAAADLRLVVGNMEPHQFMGFSGGVKSAVIGLAGVETINRNHALMADPRAKLGAYENNPARQDVEEIGRIVGVHLALNGILNEHKQLVAAVAGEPRAVMDHGIPLVRQIFQVAVTEPFDLVIASPGGHPKDINLYQAQKGLAHAALVTKDGGTIILVAACSEGSGSDKYENWVRQLTSHREVFERFEREGFRVGPHKAFQISRDASRVRVLFVSEQSPEFVKRVLLQPAASLEEALSLALAELPASARIGLMPLANATIPSLDSLRHSQ